MTLVRPTSSPFVSATVDPLASGALPWEAGGGANAVPPANTVAPVISGNPYAGATLSTTDGTWTGTPPPTFTYQWERDGVAIGGATSSTYVVQIADEGTVPSCVVTATNGAGSATAEGTGTAIWSPADDANAKLWLRGDKGVTLVSTKVSVWASQAGDASLEQATDANRPTFTASHASFNNRAVITCAGSHFLRDTSFTAIAQRYVVIVVARSTSGATQILVDDGGGTADSPAIFYASGSWRAGSPTNLDSGDTTLTGTRVHLLDANGASSKYYIDNLTTAKVSGNAGANGPNSLTVGANSSGAGGLNGQFAEIIITSTTDWTTNYRPYLNAFYALSLT